MRRLSRTMPLVATCLGLLLASTGAWSYNLPQESAVPGGIKLIRLDDHGTAQPYVDADGNRALTIQDGSTWVAVVGIPLAAALGEHQVIARDAQGRQELQFTVGNKP